MVWRPSTAGIQEHGETLLVMLHMGRVGANRHYDCKPCKMFPKGSLGIIPEAGHHTPTIREPPQDPRAGINISGLRVADCEPYCFLLCPLLHLPPSLGAPATSWSQRWTHDCPHWMSA